MFLPESGVIVSLSSGKEWDMIGKNVAVIALLVLVSACETPPVAGSSVDLPTAKVSPPVYYVPDFLREPFVTEIGDRIFFSSNSSELRLEARAVLLRQASWLKANTGYSVMVEGHADERGTRDYNFALASDRAEAVRIFLLAQGLDARRVSSISYGKERPVALGSNEAAWSQNRRAVTVLK
jgi:peptidoglycan-associated lipoprotein